MQLVSSIIIIVCVKYVYSKCSTTYVTRCDKMSDIHCQPDWKELIIESDQCRAKSPEAKVSLTQNAFRGCSTLEDLYIIQKLNDIQPAAFTGLDALISLKLYGNTLKILPRASFSHLQALKVDLQYNSVENMVHGLFVDSDITSIDLSHNKLTNIQVDMVNLESLKKLKITHNQLSQFAAYCFHENLEYLNMANNLIGDLPLEVLNNLKNLKELVLSGNKITKFKNGFRLEGLETLDLSQNSIQVLENGAFRNILQLKYLYLNNNNLTHINDFAFPADSIINVLHLHLNKLVSLNENLGERLRNLNEISIGGNPWACVCLQGILPYLQGRHISLSSSDTSYFGSGNFPVCVVFEGGLCTGKEQLDGDMYKNFVELIVYD